MFDSVPAPGAMLEEIFVFSRAHPLSRPRARRGHTRVYQPLTNQEEMREELARYHRPGDHPYKRPIYFQARVFYQRPTYNQKPHINAADIDNVTKAILDNLVATEILEDDRIVVGIDVTKAYSVEDCVIIRIFEAIHVIEKLPRGLPGWHRESNF